MKIVAISNQKGGVGKTTTTVNLAASLVSLGHRVLLVDSDPQGNATSSFGLDGETVPYTLYPVLTQQVSMADAILHQVWEGLDLVAASPDLAGAEVELVSEIARETRLRQAVQSVAEHYDIVLVDCPPSLGLLTLNALVAATGTLIPLQCEYFAMEGLSHLLRTIDLVKSQLNPELAIDGILLTMFDMRNNICHQVAEDVTEHFGWAVFETVIPRNVRLSEAPSFGLPAVAYDKESKGASSYRALAREVAARLGLGQTVSPQ